jgi:exodeoxyribonuclease VII small subunit
MKDFEKKIARLEQVAEKMRDPDLPLEKSFGLFEEGVSLARELKGELDALQGKVEVLLNSLEETGMEQSTSPRIADFETSEDEQQTASGKEDE